MKNGFGRLKNAFEIYFKVVSYLGVLFNGLVHLKKVLFVNIYICTYLRRVVRELCTAYFLHEENEFHHLNQYSPMPSVDFRLIIIITQIQ